MPKECFGINLVTIKKLRMAIKEYQLTGIWSEELHLIIDQFIKSLLNRWNTKDIEDDYQSCYLLIMEVMHRIKPSKRPHCYLTTCCVHMLQNKCILEKQQNSKRIEYWESNRT